MRTRERKTSDSFSAWMPRVTTLRQGCVRELASYGLVALGYYVVLRFVMDVPPGFIPGATLMLSVFGYFLLRALGTACIPSPDVRAVARAEAGHPPRDGHLAAIHGPVVVLDAALHSPLQGLACAAYAYAIMRPTVDAEGNPTAYKDFRGFACAPCAVRTSYGDVSLLGVGLSSLADLEQVSLPAKTTWGRALRHVEQTAFQAEPLSGVQTAAGALRPFFDGPVPAIRWDYCQDDAALTHAHTFFETILAVGQPVTAIGLFSEDRQALVTHETVVLRLMPGGLAASRERLRRDAGGALLVAAAMCIVSHGIFAFLWLTDAFA